MPKPPLGLAWLMRQNFAAQKMAPLAQELMAAAAQDPQNTAALLDAAVILQFYGHPQMAMTLQQEALKTRRHYCLPAQKPARLRLLALMSPGLIDANVPLECLLESADIELHQYYMVDPDDALEEVPDHDLLFVAMCESEANRARLTALTQRLRHWPRPILNRPEHIPNVARDTASQRLSGLPGMLMPTTLRVPRDTLSALAGPQGHVAAESLGLSFPLIVRPVDSHAGNDLHKVDTPHALAAVLDQIPGAEGFVAPFIDYSGPDSLFRKYRVVLIDGRPFVAHGATSSHWMVHYLNAGMADDARKRAEEADFMARFDTDFALRHAQTLRAMNDTMALDYWGMDCAELADGRLLVFEVDTAMVVHAMDPVEVYPYKPAVMHKLFAAFRAMLMRAAGLPITSANHEA